MNRKHIFRDGMDVLIRRIPVFALAFCLLCGMLLGRYYATCGDQTYFLLMRMAPGCPVSIVGLTAVVFLPFLISAFAVYVSHPELMLPVCFCKAFMLACCGFSTVSVFRSAGWLVRLLLQFTDTLSLPALCWFWIRHIGGSRRNLWSDLLVCGGVVMFLGVIDHCVISPYLVSLIEY